MAFHHRAIGSSGQQPPKSRRAEAAENSCGQRSRERRVGFQHQTRVIHDHGPPKQGGGGAGFGRQGFDEIEALEFRQRLGRRLEW